MDYDMAEHAAAGGDLDITPTWIDVELTCPECHSEESRHRPYIFNFVTQQHRLPVQKTALILKNYKRMRTKPRNALPKIKLEPRISILRLVLKIRYLAQNEVVTHGEAVGFARMTIKAISREFWNM